MKSPSLTVIAAAVATSFAMHAAVAQTTDQKAAPPAGDRPPAQAPAPAADRPPAQSPAPAADRPAVQAPARTADRPADSRMNYSDRERVKSWGSEKEQLEQALKVGASKDDYRKILADNGFTITAINKDTADYVEYEVVKGEHSYEVQIDFDKNTNMGSKVDVDRNLWRAQATREAMRSGKAVLASKPLSDGDVYSDRTYRQAWTDEKERLEKVLVPGNDLAFYTGELKKMGYEITSTNDTEKNYAEFEIVKGRDSYEVQIDLDDAGKAKKVDVTTNMWQSEATEKALERQK